MEFDEFVHTGPETLAGRYLRSFWQPVCCAYELKTGQALPVKILSEEFTVYRGASGSPYLLGPRCAHRGTKLSVGWSKANAFAAFIMAGSTMAEDSVWSSRRKDNPSRTKYASRVIQSRNILG